MPPNHRAACACVLCASAKQRATPAYKAARVAGIDSQPCYYCGGPAETSYPLSNDEGAAARAYCTNASCKQQFDDELFAYYRERMRLIRSGEPVRAKVPD